MLGAAEMTQQEILPSFIIRSCLATVFCALTAHVWLCWDDLATSLAPLKIVIQKLAAPAGLCTSFESKLCSEFEKARKARGRFFIEVLQVPLTSLQLLLLCFRSAAHKHDWGFAIMALFLLVRYAACLYYSYCIKVYRIPAVDMSIVFKCSMLLMVLIVWNAETDEFLMNGGWRCGMRVFNAILLLDCRAALKWNACYSVVVFFLIWERRESLCTAGQSPTEAVVGHCWAEFCTFVCVVAVPFFLESCEQDRIKASLESSQSAKAYQAIQRMLNIFCDAQLRICHQSNIIAHSPHLVHLMGTGDREGEMRTTLTGVCFLRYIEEPDRQRFQDFISAAAVPPPGDASPRRAATPPGEGPRAEGCAVGPATSIQVSLRKDSVGRAPRRVKGEVWESQRNGLGTIWGCFGALGGCFWRALGFRRACPSAGG
ncbi:unnamed protein product, partial [Prorocentrum cordatum]